MLILHQFKRIIFFLKEPIGVLVRSMIKRGQTIQQLLSKTVAYSNDKHARIIGWKYDEDLKAFIISGSCELFYFYAKIANFPQ